jgi:ABC-type transport system involved in cytochrome c biogenesis ATPase subunit
MLSTLLPPTSGQAEVVGCDLIREPNEVRERIGYVGQRNASDPGVSARKELEFQARLYGASRAEARKRTNEILNVLELESCADRPSSTYSGGQRRRLDIGIGLIHGPQLLFLDEPTNGLAELRSGVIERLRVAPVSRFALLVGRTARDIVIMLTQALLLILLALPFGLSIHPAGVVLMLALLALLGLMMTPISYAIALWLGSEDSFAPLIFTATLPLPLLSGVLLPLTLAPDWLRGIAAANRWPTLSTPRAPSSTIA